MEIETEFRKIIREKLKEKDFWEWVSSWLDVDLVLDIAENWDIETKKEAIKELKQQFPYLS